MSTHQHIHGQLVKVSHYHSAKLKVRQQIYYSILTVYMGFNLYAGEICSVKYCKAWGTNLTHRSILKRDPESLQRYTRVALVVFCGPTSSDSGTWPGYFDLQQLNSRKITGELSCIQ